MINCIEISLQFEEINIHLSTSTPTFLEFKEEMYESENTIFKVREINTQSNLQLNIEEIIPIKLYENNDYWVKLVFPEEIVLPAEFLYQIVNRTNNELVFKFNSSNYVGILNFSFLGITTPIIEVLSRKIDYQNEYSSLLQRISEIGIDLVTRASSLFENNVEHKEELIEDNKLLSSKLSFIKSKILSGEFELLYNSFLRKPLTRVVNKSEKKSIWEVDSFEFDSYFEGILNDPIKDNNGNIYPSQLNQYVFDDSIDNVENQFLKYFLELIVAFLSEVKEIVDNLKLSFLQIEINKCIEICNRIYGNPIFDSISKMRYFPSKSNVLQSKHPYRQLYVMYSLMFFEVSIIDNKLNADMRSSVKDLPKLYEYYCYITFIEILVEKFKLKSWDISSIIKYNSQNLCYIISAETNGIEFQITDSKKLVLYYNKSYTSNEIIYNGRSYSHNLDPDISVEYFINNNLVGIVHFDAKYKLEKEESFKSEDIDKMHTYKDAILGTIGAYVLYPGEKSEKFYQEEKIATYNNCPFPSVGAFVLKVNSTLVEKEKSSIEMLIDDLLKVDDYLIQKGIFSDQGTKEIIYLKRLID